VQGTLGTRSRDFDGVKLRWTSAKQNAVERETQTKKRKVKNEGGLEVEDLRGHIYRKGRCHEEGTSLPQLAEREGKSRIKCSQKDRKGIKNQKRGSFASP